jgi:hypothetical protein
MCTLMVEMVPLKSRNNKKKTCEINCHLFLSTIFKLVMSIVLPHAFVLQYLSIESQVKNTLLKYLMGSSVDQQCK